MKNILLVDGNSVLFRAYYSTLKRPMKTANGIATNAVFGFNRMLNNVLDKIQPDYALVAFDTGDKTFRHKLFDDYKGTRKPLPEELIVQFPLVRELLTAMNICFVEQSGFEADDIIGSCATKYQDYQVNILTGDKDLLQLVDNHTSVWIMRTGISDMDVYTPATFYDKYGLTAKQMIDLKGLMGDASDNIPGVSGVGEKTAIKLLQQYQSVEGVIENVDELKGALAQKIKTGTDIALLSKQLATIKTDMDINLDLNQMSIQIDYENLYKFYHQYEMNALKKEIEDKIDHQDEAVNFQEVDKMPVSILNQTDNVIIFDYNNTDYYHLLFYGCALYDGNTAYYLSYSKLVSDQDFLDYLISDVRKIVFDAKEIYHLFFQHQLSLPNQMFDIMIAAHLVDNSMSDWQTIANKYGLYQDTETVKDLFEQHSANIEGVAKKSRDLYGLAKQLLVDLKEKEMESLFSDIEMPLTKVLFAMENQGILMDRIALNQYSETIYQKIELLEQQIYQEAQMTFNINSPKQMAEVLFDHLKLPQIKKRSTAIEVLNKLSDKHKVVALIIEYRKYQKIFSTYAEGLKKHILDDGRIHTIYRQTVTQTGRLSSINPNLQNISVRSEEGREVRKSFIADQGCWLVSSDYSQIELRILAHMSQETKLIQAFIENKDIHTQIACEIFDVKSSEVTSEMRRKAKAVNFGIVYGISDFGLSQQLEIPRHEAQEYIDRYFSIYPGIKTFMDEVIKQCQKDGYVKTLLNRRREIPEINDRNFMTREFGKRAAMNAPIQGSAADLIKVAMVKIDEEIRKQQLKSKMILQVHDELIFNVLDEELTTMMNLIETQMKQAMQLLVPLEVECKKGHTWFEAK